MSPATAPVPVVLVTGIEPAAMDAATIGIQFDLPSAVVVRHELDPQFGTLTRVISDVTGILEREAIHLEHACVSCAIREDVVPTLCRLADLGRWEHVVAVLPATAEARQVCRVVALADDVAERVRIASVVATFEGPSLVDTLTGDALLCERELHTTEDDRRGLAETAGGLVEQADVLVVHGDSSAEAVDLLAALARPGARVVGDDDALGGLDLVQPGAHDHDLSEEWVDEVRMDELPALPEGGRVWQLDLRSERPFHPERLHARLEDIGSGAHRSRGCFWLPTRPDVVGGWDGAGGQVSIGSVGSWGVSLASVLRHEGSAGVGGSHSPTPPRLTRLVITGLESLTTPAEREAMRQAFEDCLLTDEEVARMGVIWERASDGFEPWLGDIRSAA